MYTVLTGSRQSRVHKKWDYLDVLYYLHIVVGYCDCRFCGL